MSMSGLPSSNVRLHPSQCCKFLVGRGQTPLHLHWLSMPLVLHRGLCAQPFPAGWCVIGAPIDVRSSARLGPLFSVPTRQTCHASHQQFPVKPGGVKVAVGDRGLSRRIGYGVVTDPVGCMFASNQRNSPSIPVTSAPSSWCTTRSGRKGMSGGNPSPMV